ncbi:MAG: WYL domain-containing protein [Cyanobacteria bacterium J083]|nr:MAG: WYL domain-containing protein [Cyanobacteria bacterium J083]
MTEKIKQKYGKNSQAFERLMLLIATFVQYPGIGCKDELATSETSEHHDALSLVQAKLREVAQELGINLPPGYPAVSTIRKDLEALRCYQILEPRMYRWGYYLGTGVMSKADLKVAFDGLKSQAVNQGDAKARKIEQRLAKRLRGFSLGENQDFFYPVRQYLNRAINYTDPEEMMSKGENRHTLYHQLETVEQAILQGQVIKIFRAVNMYEGQSHGMLQVYPLQLVYHDLAWYLLHQDWQTGHLAIGRINRFTDYCQIVTPEGRGNVAQQESLTQAYKLLKQGWGLNLGQEQEQKQELASQLDFVALKVRFFPNISRFIAEGELRHPNQKIRYGEKDSTTGKPKYVDYLISLPPRSLNEFSIWVQRYADKAQVLSPPELVQKHRQIAMALANRYQLEKKYTKKSISWLRY